MTTFHRFEEIQAWQLARQLTREVYAMTNSGAFAKDFGLRDQIRRAAVSVMSNIAEGFERRGNREFARFLSIAKGSAGEVNSQLYVALDQNYIEPVVFERLSKLTIELGKKIGALSKYLLQTSNR
jgi:four helix bundle protein